MSRGVDLRFPQGLVVDKDVREMFEIIRKFLRGNPLFQFRGALVELKLSASATNLVVPHNLGFKPRDALVVSKNTATLTFNFDKFTDTTYFVTTAGTGLVSRFLLGTFGED